MTPSTCPPRVRMAARSALGGQARPGSGVQPREIGADRMAVEPGGDRLGERDRTTGPC